jgi:hypothetical protein
VLEERSKVADVAAGFGVSERTAYRWTGCRDYLAELERLFRPAELRVEKPPSGPG